jgi:hypothetical protein
MKRKPKIARRDRMAAAVAPPRQQGSKPERVGSLADFFAASPLRNSGLRTERLKHAPRPIKL